MLNTNSLNKQKLLVFRDKIISTKSQMPEKVNLSAYITV